MSERYLYEQARKAIDQLFSDTSVPQGQTWLDLNTLRQEIEDLLSTIDRDDWGEEDQHE